MTWDDTTWRDVYPFHIDLGLVNLGGDPFTNVSWDQFFNGQGYKYHIDWNNQKLGFKTEEDKVKFILRWL